jgi:hypothetical protein
MRREAPADAEPADVIAPGQGGECRRDRDDRRHAGRRHSRERQHQPGEEDERHERQAAAARHRPRMRGALDRPIEYRALLQPVAHHACEPNRAAADRKRHDDPSPERFHEGA